MLQIEIESADGSKTLLQAPAECVIGRAAQSEVRLEGWRVAKEHARLSTTPGGVLLEDLGAFGGVLVNGQRIDEQYGPLQPGDVIGIASYKLRVSAAGAASGIAQSPYTQRVPMVARDSISGELPTPSPSPSTAPSASPSPTAGPSPSPSASPSPGPRRRALCSWKRAMFPAN